MSLADRINQNTQSVIDGKTALVDAIETKGGTVGDYAVYPSFGNLVDGVESILTVNDIVGAEEVVSLAVGDIPKGTVCSLVDVAGNFEAVETIAFPVTAKHGNATYSLTTEPIKLDSEGKLIARGRKYSTTANSYYYLFCLVDGEYKQMTYEGEYTYIGGTDVPYPYSAFASTTYDKVTNNLFWSVNTTGLLITHLDFENLNITRLYNATFGGSTSTGFNIGSSGCIFAHNNNFFMGGSMPLLYKYNPDTNTVTYIGVLDAIMGIGSYSDYMHVFGTAIIGNYLYVCVRSRYYNNSDAEQYLAKFMYDSSSGQYLYQSKIKTGKNVDYFSNTSVSTLHMNLDATLVIYKCFRGGLMASTINPITMTVLSQDVALTFSDGLDTTKIDAFSMVRGTNYLYVRSTDTDTYSEAELVRLYEYDSETGVYNFICCPALSFSPATASNVLPSHYNLDDGAYTPFQKSDTTYSMYRVGKASLEYDVTAEPCNNTLIESATGYGIATEDIANGETGRAVVILKA